MPDPTLSTEALADLAAGGTEPLDLTPTARVVVSLRALADLLEAHGDMGEHDSVMPYVSAHSLSAGMDGPVLRAMLRAEAAGLCEVRRYAWRPTQMGSAREVYGQYRGTWIKTTESVSRPACGHCGGTGHAPTVKCGGAA